MSADADLLDLAELRDSARKLLDHHRASGGSPEELWASLSALGWTGLSAPVDHGGLGQPFAALAVLYEELGRILAPHSFIATTACVQGLLELAGEVGIGPLIADALRGDAIFADLTAPDVSITSRDSRLVGVARDVPDVHRSTHLLVRVDALRPKVLLITLPQTGVTLLAQASWDESRRLYDVIFNDVVIDGARMLTTSDVAVSMCAVTQAHTDLALASDSLGSAQALFDETLAYLLQRRQFGRQIGAFQVIKHRCADLATALAGARSLLGAAGRQYSMRDGDWRASAAACRLQAERVCREVCEDAVQLHGGIGFTWDHICHRHLKRSRCSEVLGGSVIRRLDTLAPALFRAARAAQPVDGDTLAK